MIPDGFVPVAIPSYRLRPFDVVSAFGTSALLLLSLLKKTLIATFKNGLGGGQKFQSSRLIPDIKSFLLTDAVILLTYKNVSVNRLIEAVFAWVKLC